jgi:hypothetical protein
MRGLIGGEAGVTRGGAVVVSSKRADDVEDAGLFIRHDIYRQHFKGRAARSLEGTRPSVELDHGVGALPKGAVAADLYPPARGHTRISRDQEIDDVDRCQ